MAVTTNSTTFFQIGNLPLSSRGMDDFVTAVQGGNSTLDLAGLPLNSAWGQPLIPNLPLKRFLQGRTGPCLRFLVSR